MVITLASENMLKAFEESENNQEDSNDDRDFWRVLKRFENTATQSHNEIRYSNGEIRNWLRRITYKRLH